MRVLDTSKNRTDDRLATTLSFERSTNSQLREVSSTPRLTDKLRTMCPKPDRLANPCARSAAMCPKTGRSANVVPKMQRCARRRTLCHEPTNQAQEGPTDPSRASYRRACFWGWFWENLGMARDYRPALHGRAFLLPLDMRDWLPEDHF